jgi:hypothetical protein
MKQSSGLGIVSVVLALVAGLLMLLGLVGAAGMAASDPDLLDEDSPAVVGLGLLMLGGFGLDLLALALGVIGLFQSDRSKTMPIVGVCLSGLPTLGVGALMVLGLLAG